MFQLLYLRFTRPRADPTAFAAFAAQIKGLLENRAASPDVAFDQTMDALLTGNHPRRQPDTPETVARWDLAKSLAFYKARFADASHFHFGTHFALSAYDLTPILRKTDFALKCLAN